ncbi:MAG: DUF2190 domain-containing protein [Burkholderiales bacterium RIFCSPLOWO2_12_67_14]|nr:MAG: DUF2190 domain-containing protein [Burkholderiales bacterium RIFCSPLOWO2_02_FULL_67_64]OGB40003.1 MAG: DUF2190 domain-containing protein [Burkholderiales bacterium RIFCSPHIGHO2_12_FULL_67_38]OGB47898.1 MAG: DUF2190 domain-containing protein [Burkholderiales bacterium RIFCSPLOWO2_12_67_14]OGB87188.1 MAG: DUF2190 domain-containing protein [Burkholderiales bacterium RIFCSPLOWO2_12_FULL_67_210]
MASQNNTGRQYDKQHAVTLVATAALAAHRFVAYDGGYPSVAGGAKDSQGVTETAAEIGDAVTAVTGYSYLVEAEAAIAFGDLVKVGTDGKAITGTAADHCGRALGAATQAGQLIEVQLYKHVHA